MKDITHYFSDLAKNGGNEAVPLKEVKAVRAKIDDPNVLVQESRAKKKRGRVKIKISRKSKEGTVCDILESSDLVDKTPSPYPQSKNGNSVLDGETPKRKNQLNPISESSIKNVCLKAKRRVKNNIDPDFKTQANNTNDFSQNKDQTDCTRTIKEKKEDNNTKEDSSSKKTKTKKEKVEKLIELADKKGYSKRKLVEEEEAAKIEKRLEKRKKLFTVEPNNKHAETNKGDDSPKNSDIPNTKRTGNLLNYFSKATPEQLEKERLMKVKVTVRAEIHTPDSSPVHPSDNLNKINKDLLKNDSTANLKQSQDQFDEILLIQSETVTVSPKNEKFPTSQKHKPKWSLKIQLQTNGNIPSGIADDDMYTPTAAVKFEKENRRNNKKIPKILLPIKNKKGDLSNSSSDSQNSKKREERKNLTDVSEEKLKTDNIKTDVNKWLNHCSTTDLCKANEATSQDDDDECLIVEENLLKRKSQEKLAPLFTKKLKPNPEVVAARRLFLQSDIQENGNGNETRKLIPLGPTSLPFPKFSHINQLSSDVATLENVFSFTLKTNSVPKTNIDVSQMKNILKVDTSMPKSKSLFSCTKADIETALSEIESYYPHARTLWKLISQISKNETPRKSQKNKRRVSDKKNAKKPIDTSNELLHSPWTDKYKPKSSAEILGNEEAASKLRSWLENWKSLKTEDYSSGDEFYTSDCSMSNNIENNQVAVLIGPHGSGKTASVYAVAEELGYKVIEVNASSKRPGKKILKDFEEATKSHRVKKSHLKDLLIPVSKKIEETKKISENSLILMEDIDLIFEEDEGFISAAFQLASNTKRPIVMTLRGTCSHLPKMAAQQFRIDFQEACEKKVLALLRLITLAETSSTLSQNCANDLYQNGDLRRALLQLQYLLLSGKNNVSLLTLSLRNSSWMDMRTYIYKPAIKAEKSKKKKETHSNKNNNEVLDDLVNNLDSFALISTLMKIEDPTSNLFDLKAEPSMSLIENSTMYSSLDNIGSEIGEWLINRIHKSVLSDVKTNTSNSQVLTKKQINTGVDCALSQIPSNTLDRRALALDYLSNIRTICRAEEIRNQQNSKRGNRFFHYFQSSRLSTAVTKSNILSAACKMLQNKATVNADT